MANPTENFTIEDMYEALEAFGVKREMLESLHPSSDTLSHLYLSIKSHKRENPKNHLDH